MTRIQIEKFRFGPSFARLIFLLCCAVVSSRSLLHGQPAPIDADQLSRGPSTLELWKPYRQTVLPPVNTNNGPLLRGSIREGQLLLSLSDFLKLVVENGLDVESDRYLYLLAETDLLRARSGQAARGLPGAAVPAGLFAGAIGAGLGNNANVSAGGTGAAAISGAAKLVAVGPRGNFDPSFSVNFSYDRVISPLNTTRVAGTDNVTVPSTDLQTRFQQELPFGGSYSVSFNIQRQSTTQRFLLYDPAFTSYFSLQFYQPLLNGFGTALNRRFITVTENNRRISREIFSQNLTNSLANAADLYWDFVAFAEQVKVAEQAVAASEKLVSDDQREFEAGVLARLDVVQAQSQLAANRRDLIAAQTNLQMQEIKLKSVISRTITRDLDDVHITPSDRLPQPDDIPIPDLDDAVKGALESRASIRQAQLGIENQRIAQTFTRNNLLPVLAAFVQFNSYSLASGTTPMFRQMMEWNYPEYSYGFSLTFPLKNRAAQADNVRARLELRQSEASFQQVRSQVELGVRTATVGLVQFKATVRAAQRAVETSEQAFRGEQIRLANGISTPYRVILAQRDLVTAQSALVQAQVNYAKAAVAEELATGSLLAQNGIAFDSAFKGGLWRSARKF